MREYGKTKKGCSEGASFLNTEDRNRTDTRSPSPDFESGASTSSATPARKTPYSRIQELCQAFFSKKMDGGVSISQQQKLSLTK